MVRQATAHCGDNIWSDIELWLCEHTQHLSLVSVSASEQLWTLRQSVSNQANQAGKQPKQTAGGWAMVGQCSCGLDLTPGRGGLMTNWCLGSITVSTLPTPVGRLNGSILSVKLTFLSLSISLSLSGSPPPPVCLSGPEGGTVGV